jgi:integrase/recombinase XerD
MTIYEAINLFRNQQMPTLKRSTQYCYEIILRKLEQQLWDIPLESLKPEDLVQLLEDNKRKIAQSTRYLRYAQLKSFFNFIHERTDVNIENPCYSPLLVKLFRKPKKTQRKILDKEIVDEMIYKTKNIRDRLILELQARCGLRVGELLKLKASDVVDRKLVLQEPKSGKESELAFMPEQIAARLRDYIDKRQIGPGERIFPVSYSTVRVLVKKLGSQVNASVSPHDLRRHSATYASRNGVPLEIVSKVILRHQDLKTTQIYLGKVSDTEAIRWMDNLHGK